MSGESFTATTPVQRITALLDHESLVHGQVQAHGSLVSGTGMIGGREVTIIATDRSMAGGSFGVVESKSCAELLEQSRSMGRPFIMCLDSAGVRLDGGLPALGAFRQLYRHMLDARLSGLPSLALIGRDCFGGASMLAATCTKRVYCQESRLAMSGPAVIQALGGFAELDATDFDAVTALMGGAARAKLLHSDQLCDDFPDAFRLAARAWVAECGQSALPYLQRWHTQLGTRLLAQGVAPAAPGNTSGELPEVLREIIPHGVKVHRMDGVLIGRSDQSSTNAFFGFIDGAAVGALAIWTLAGECLALAGERGDVAVTVFLDAPGQATTLRDERLMISEYVAHLSLVLSSLRERGHRVTLQIFGDAGGGIYVGLAASVGRVVALPGASIRLLPPAAMTLVLRRNTESGSVDECMSAGVIDTLI